MLPPPSELPSVTADHIHDYENALDAFVEGRWQEAKDRLDHVPDGDGAKAFLTEFVAERQWRPPEDWDGVITLDGK